MNIPELIKEAHDIAVERRDYDCPCLDEYSDKIERKIHRGQIFRYGEYIECPICNGSSINPNKNIGEVLMLIVTKLGEALEAHRNNMFADWNGYEMLIGTHNKKEWNRDDFKKENAQYYFESKIKDTFEDKIADVFIRLFDLCGYLGIELFFEESYNESNDIVFSNVGEDLYFMLEALPVNIQMRLPHIYNKFFTYLILFSKHHQIPIEKHIKARMAYNRSLI